MNNEELKSVAEKKALEALSLNIFRGFDLVNTKNVLAQMLAHIGRDGMFSEYTKHDISHVNGMLALLDDIIVERASDAMTPSDWLMIVLSVYFHDLGMIITNEEFEHREDDDDFMDYYRDLNKKSYEALKPENRDKAIYQDYVRTVPGQTWTKLIFGSKNANTGNTEHVDIYEVSKIGLRTMNDTEPIT